MRSVQDEKRRIRRHIENLGSGDDTVSSRAERTLIRSYGARALEELIEACTHPNPVVRFRTVWILGHTGDDRAYDAILRLTDDADERVRYDATLALGVLANGHALAPLTRFCLEHDPSRPGADALARMGLKALPAVKEVLRQGDAETRHSAVNVLGHFACEHGDARSVRLLRKSLHDPDPEVCEDAAWWLSEAGMAPP